MTKKKTKKSRLPSGHTSSSSPNDVHSSSPETGTTSQSPQKALGGIESDKVYFTSKPNSTTSALYSEADNAYYYDAITGMSYEIEFGRNAIVATILTNASDDTRNGRWAPIELRRIAILGDFSYQDGKVLSANVTSMATGGLGKRGNDEYHYGVIHQPAFRELKNPDNLNSWGFLWEGATIVNQYEKTPLSETGSIEALTSFGGGKYFYTGWENNPFDSNLI